MMEESLVVMVRAIIAFFTLLIFTRLLGKQQLGKLTFFDYINGIVMGSIAGTLATDLSSKAWVHWVGLATFVVLTFGFQFSTLKNRYLSKVIDDEPTVVIKDGKILENHLSKMRIKIDELNMLLRQKDIFDLTQVEFAIMEPDGNLSVLPKSEYLPVNRKDLNMPVTRSRLTTELIIDGIVIEQNLKQVDKNKSWLLLELESLGIKELEQVYYAALLPNGKLYVDQYKDKMDKNNDISDYEGPY